MRCTSRTPPRTSMSRISKSTRGPTAPSTVCCVPVERCTSNPMLMSRSMTCWICSSVAASCIATIIASLAVARRSFVHIHIEFCRSDALRLLDHDLFLLQISHDVDDALEHLRHVEVAERPLVHLLHVREDLLLAVG